MLYFGSKLRALRQEKELTQQQLADRLGVTKATISAYETNAKYPSVEVLIALSIFFHVSADYLLGLSEQRQTEYVHLTDEQNQLINELIRQFLSLNQKNTQRNLDAKKNSG